MGSRRIMRRAAGQAGQKTARKGRLGEPLHPSADRSISRRSQALA
jgi:hypothetical protein